jgi:hypothetical protein
VSSGLGLGSRRDRLAIPSAAAAAISQMLATVARLGGRAHIPWSPAIGPSVFGNSDGSGGVPGVGGAVGMLLDSSNGWGVPGTPDVATPKDLSVTWTALGTVSGRGPLTFTTVGSGGVIRSAAMVVGATYLVRAVGTTTATNITIRNGANATGAIVMPTGSFNVNQLYVQDATDPGLYLRNEGDGVTTFTTLEVRQLTLGIATALTQPTGINKPLLASGAVPWAGALVFDGSNDSMLTANIAGSATETVICAFSMNSLPASSDPFNRGVAVAQGSFFGRVSSNGSMSVGIHDGTSFRFGTSSAGLVSVGVPIVGTWVKGASRSYCRINGSEVASTAFVAGAQAAPVPFTVATGQGNFAPATYQLPGLWIPSELSAADLAVLERGAAAIAGLPI